MPSPDDKHAAEAVISNGISSGGLKALGQSIAMSAQKNRTVLEQSINDANTAYYNLFDAKYHAPEHTGPAAPAAPSPDAATKAPPLPSGVPSGSQYSASRQQWRDADGNMYNADGSKAK